jgi:hypothetical protein
MSDSELHSSLLLGYLLIVKIHNQNGYRRCDVLSPSQWQAERHAKLNLHRLKPLGGLPSSSAKSWMPPVTSA